MVHHAHFSKGAEIEATVDDDGFHGAWYAATVFKPPSEPPNPKVTVQYKTLIDDEIETNFLRETLDIDAIRPAPPSEALRKFISGEEVDAFHSDGWWEGVITEVLEDSKYSVFFPGTTEQLVFKERDLRIHREWMDGKWIPPLENEIVPHKAIVKSSKTVGKEKFNKGSLVEISSDEEGFRGAWFAASVIKSTGKDKFMIEYQSLRTDDDTDLLREEVDVFHIRPCPPETVVVDRYSRFEEVDALYNDGWWVGVIYRALSHSRYIVFFRGTNEEMEFDHSDLRVHQDWMDGKWLVPSRDLLM